VRSGGAVAQNGARAAGEDAGHPAPVAGKAAVTDGVHPLVDPHQMSLRHESLDRGLRVAEGHELPPSHDSVLQFRQLA